MTLIQSGAAAPGTPPPGVREVFAEVGDDLERMVFSGEDHRRSAAVLQAIERSYDSSGPDYVEVCDYHAHGLVPLQARRAGHPLLAEAPICVKVSATSELIGLYDGTLNQPGMRLVAALEREQLRLADRLLCRGGTTLDLYRRYYSDLALPEPATIRGPMDRPAAPPSPAPRDPRAPLKMLYVGRLQRFKGVLDLVDACLALPRDDWSLTLIGADTDTAPMGQSVRRTIEAMCGEDPRFRIEDALPHDELQRRWGDHDLLVTPSRLEVWGNVAVEAMRAGLPVLATPVGGLSEIVEPGVTGWHLEGTGAEALARALTRLLEDREELERVRASGAVFERFLNLTDPEEVLAGYDELFASLRTEPRKSPPSPAAGGSPVSATAIVPYHGSSAFAEEAVDSLLAQTHAELDVLIVNDGSFEESDELIDRLCENPRVSTITQLNRGEAAARNLGARLARGRFLVMLDADNVLEPGFVERAISMLRADPDLAYVTCGLRLLGADGAPQADPSAYVPLGNSVLADDSGNWDGDAIAVLPRALFSELGYRYEPDSGIHADWDLYRRLREDGRFGAVIPECLARYRIRPESLSRTHDDRFQQRGWDEDLIRRDLRRLG